MTIKSNERRYKMRDREEINIFGTVSKFIAPAIIILLLIGSFYIIPAGDRGVLLTFGKPSMDAKGEGLHIKIPLIQQIKKMDVKTLRFDAPQASAASSDLQTVTTDVTLNYRITPESVPTMYQTIGINYQDKIIVPAVQEVLKASTAKYTAEELITKRPLVKEDIDVALKERLLRSNIIVTEISITDFKFSDVFNTAIENKVTAEQNALAAKNKLVQIEYEAQQRVTQARGEADAIAIQAQAINAQGGKDYVQLQAIGKWNGQLPTFVGSSDMPFIGDLGSLIASKTNTA